MCVLFVSEVPKFLDGSTVFCAVPGPWTRSLKRFSLDPKRSLLKSFLLKNRSDMLCLFG